VKILPGTAESYWLASTTETSYPSLADDASVDVAVVGGGIAGICTAWELSRAGRSVVLLESDRIVAGVTGCTTAKLSSVHSLIYGKISTLFGGEAARLYAGSQQGAVEHVADVVAELGIDCDLERPGTGAVLQAGGSRCAVYWDEARAARGVRPVHPPGMHSALQRRRAGLGVPMPRIAIRHRRLRDPGAGEQAARTSRNRLGVLRPGRLVRHVTNAGVESRLTTVRLGVPPRSKGRRT
jgi:glycine/D-amino acid oxidase-like deaminating enzyme